MRKFVSAFGKSDGAIMLEFVLCFPILFTLFLFAIQFAQILTTWQVVHYSAYVGARSTMTCNYLQRKSRAEFAVKRVLAVVSNSPTKSTDEKDAKNRTADKYCKIDGFGYIPHTKCLDEQVDVDVPLFDYDPRGTTCTVKFKMFLNVPVAGRIISFFAKEDKSQDEKKWGDYLEKNEIVGRNPMMLSKFANEMELKNEKQKLKMPYITLKSTSTISIPYSTMYYPTIF